VADLERHLANWYDAAMVRVSAWYRRKVAGIALAAAAVVAVLFNADTLGMARTIWVDTEVRDVIRRAADAAAQRCTLQELRSGDNPACSIDTLLQTLQTRRRLPLGWSADAMPLARAACPDGDTLRRGRDDARRIAEDPNRPSEERATAEARLRRVLTEIAAACAPGPMDYLLWAAGIVLTVVGLWLGALLWFDVLKRFVTLRTSGEPPRA
jgi:hypothetical protein